MGEYVPFILSPKVFHIFIKPGRFLADRTVTQYDGIILLYVRLTVTLCTVALRVHAGG